MNLYEKEDDIIGSSHSPTFLKIGAFKKFVIFTGKHLYWSLVSIKLLCFMLATLFKRDSKAGAFL